MIESLFHKIGHVIVTASLAVTSLFGLHHQVPAVSQNVGASIPVVVATFQSSLQSGIRATDTSMTLVNGSDTAGHALSGYICFNIDEGTTNEEFVCGTATGVSITALTRGIDPVNGTIGVAALEKPHGRGATVKVTDYPSLGIISRILNGQETVPNVITYASGVTPVSGQDLASKAYVLSVVNGGPVSLNQLIVAGTAGATITTGQLIYLKVADGKWYPTTAADTTTLDAVQLGIAQSAGTSGGSIGGGVLIRGVDTHNTGTSGAYGYASNTSGVIGTSAGTSQRIVGQFIISSGGIYFDPLFYASLTANQQAALVGNGGTPSSSNTYLTQTGFTNNYATTVQNFTSTGTWTKPAGAKAVMVIAVGGGGGGNGGTANSPTGQSGSGGGGGAAVVRTFDASVLGATETVTIGAGGAGGAGAVSSGNGGAGGAGGATTFGSKITAGGGLGGITLSSTNTSAGGSCNGMSSSSTGVGGLSCQGGLNASGDNGGGGGAGGATLPGWSSVYGGGGGGGGAQVTTTAGSNGGTSGTYVAGGGGAGGATRVAGTNGADASTINGIGFGGAGGGGGGSGTGSPNTTAVGGNGGFPGGGGGAGGAGATAASNGGGGGAGKLTVITFF